MTESDLVIRQERGQLVRHLRAMVHRNRGPEGWGELLAKVSAPCREAFGGSIGIFEWVDASLATELSVAFCVEEGEAFTAQRGRESAREQLTTINGWVLRFLSPSFLLSNLPRFFGFYFKGAISLVEYAGGREAEFHIWAMGLYPDYWRFGAPGWLEEALAMTGCKQIRVHYVAPGGEGLEAHHHRYDLSWE